MTTKDERLFGEKLPHNGERNATCADAQVRRALYRESDVFEFGAEFGEHAAIRTFGQTPDVEAPLMNVHVLLRRRIDRISIPVAQELPFNQDHIVVRRRPADFRHADVDPVFAVRFLRAVDKNCQFWIAASKRIAITSPTLDQHPARRGKSQIECWLA